MASKGTSMSSVVKFSMKYGPYVIAAVKVAKEPVTNAAKRYIADQKSQKAALDHAKTVVDGTVLKVVFEELPTWVVYSGDEAIASYPTVSSLSQALIKADLTKRQRPEDVTTMIDKAQHGVTKSKDSIAKGAHLAQDGLTKGTSIAQDGLTKGKDAITRKS